MHLVTQEVVSALPLKGIEAGILHVFIQHTSAALAINENAAPEVRTDMEMAFSRLVPESWPYRHTDEGPDDMPAHVKAALLGSSLQIPVSHGRLALGTWQGIYLCEHRESGGTRTLVATLPGEK
jgi:secondary thiamine-phosphate synthase enzyme